MNRTVTKSLIGIDLNIYFLCEKSMKFIYSSGGLNAFFNRHWLVVRSTKFFLSAYSNSEWLWAETGKTHCD